MTVWKVNGPLVLAKTTHHRHLPERHVVRPARHLVAGALPRRLPHRLALGRRAAAARRQHRVDARPGGSVHVVPNKAASLRVPLTPRGGTCTVVFDIAPTAVPSEVIPGSKDDRRARGALQRASPTGRENRLRRQPALASARRASATTSAARSPACARPPAASTSSSRSRRRACAARRASARRSPGSTSSCARGRCRRRTRSAPPGASPAIPPPSGSSARSTCSTSPTGCTRRSGPGCARRRFTTSCPLRFPEWTTKRTQSMHGRKYANAARTCDVIFVNSAFTAGETTELLGVEPARIRVAPPGVKDVFTATAPAADLGAPYILTRGHARAAQEPPGARRRAPAPRRRHPARGRRRRGLGRAAGARRPARAPARLRLRRGARAASTGAPPSPSTRRASRASGCRSSRRWRAAPPVVASSHPSMDEACGRRRGARRPGRSGCDRRRDRAGDRRARAR